MGLARASSGRVTVVLGKKGFEKYGRKICGARMNASCGNNPPAYGSACGKKSLLGEGPCRVPYAIVSMENFCTRLIKNLLGVLNKLYDILL